MKHTTVKHTPVIRAWVMAGAIVLAAGLALPAGAATSINLVVGKDNTGAEVGDVGNITCSATCLGLVDDDSVFLNDEPGTIDFVGDLADTFSSSTRVDPYDLPNSNVDTVVAAVEAVTGETNLLGLKTDINQGGNDPFCGTSGGTSCSITVGALTQYLALKIDGFTAFLKLIEPEQTITYNGQGLSHFVEIIPIPATLPLFLTGLLGFGFLARRRRQAMEA